MHTVYTDSCSVSTVPAPLSVTVSTSTGSNIIRNGSAVTVNCVVELSPAVMESEVSLVMVDAELSRDGTPLTLTDPTVTGTRFIFGVAVSSFNDNDVGTYTCTATVRPTQSSSQFLNGTGRTMSPLERIIIGKHPQICYLNDAYSILILCVRNPP